MQDGRSKQKGSTAAISRSLRISHRTPPYQIYSSSFSFDMTKSGCFAERIIGVYLFINISQLHLCRNPIAYFGLTIHPWDNNCFFCLIPAFKYDYFCISSIAAVLGYHEMILVSKNSITPVAAFFM